jgi:hypothetical protein
MLRNIQRIVLRKKINVAYGMHNSFRANHLVNPWFRIYTLASIVQYYALFVNCIACIVAEHVKVKDCGNLCHYRFEKGKGSLCSNITVERGRRVSGGGGAERGDTGT